MIVMEPMIFFFVYLKFMPHPANSFISGFAFWMDDWII